MKTIAQLVRDQVALEWPNRCEEDIDGHINAMPNTELLDRISDAIASQASGEAGK